MKDNKLHIKVFGQLTETLGTSTLESDVVPDTTTLRTQLLNRYPKLADKTFVIAVNNSICTDTCLLNEGDEIALLPPFSGG